MLQRALAAAGTPVPALRHHLSVPLPGSHSPATLAVDLAPDHHGGFQVTCSEFPEIWTFGDDEENALALAHEAIEDALWVRRIRLVAVS